MIKKLKELSKKILTSIGKFFSVKKVHVERTSAGYILHVQFKLFGKVIEDTTHSVKELSTTNVTL